MTDLDRLIRAAVRAGLVKRASARVRRGRPLTPFKKIERLSAEPQKHSTSCSSPNQQRLRQLRRRRYLDKQHGAIRLC
jgi:hypothetical protein